MAKFKLQSLGAWLLIAAAFALPLLQAPRPLRADPPNGFSLATFVEGLNAPTSMAFAPDGRLFVCEQSGKLRIVKEGVLLPEPFLELANVDGSGERGLLGVAFDPQFETTPWVYVYYTVEGSPAHNRVSRFLAEGDVADPDSPENVLLDLDDLSGATNHNGGALHFGPDNHLYVAVGDNATGANAQSKTTLKGKMLRMLPDGSTPPDNPFLSTTDGKNELIWAMGLRNPFTFAFQPGTGMLHINDVGLNAWEEVNLGAAGANYGWPTQEGPSGPNNPNFTRPIFAYNHTDPPFAGLAITGGAFYNPTTPRLPPEYVGRYFFAEYLGAEGLGYIASLDPQNPADSATLFATDLAGPVDLDVGPDGALYALLYRLGPGSDRVVRIDYTVDQPPLITLHPQDDTVTIDQPAVFTVSASGAEPLEYQWQRNEVDIAGANSDTFTLPAAQLGDSGDTFRVRVSNGFGEELSNSATLTVVTNTPPTPVILTPADDTAYVGGQNFSYQGSATDAESGTLPGSAFTWRVDFHHDEHQHPFVPDTSGSRTGSFTIPTEGETAANVWYRIHLTVTDPGGLAATTFVDLEPVKTTFTLATSPAGLDLTLDGQPFTAPLAVEGVAGIQRAIGAALTQTLDGKTYLFDGWSDGGAATHTISTPTSPTTFTAVYTLSSGAPENLQVQAASAIRAVLTWDPASGHSGYRVERRTGDGPWQEIAQPGAAAETYTDIGLTPETTYTYRVRAVVDGIPTVPTNEVQVTTPEAGKLSVSKSVNFGKVRVGTTKIGSITVKNKGQGPLPVSVGSAASPFGLKPHSFTLAKGEKRRISVSFTPAGAKTYSASVSVQSDDPLKRNNSVSLTGRGK